MNITVIGAGQGGLATAGHLTLKGHKVTLWNRSLEKLQALKKIGSITMGGVINGTVQLSAITSNLEEAIKGADIISIMITADGYESIAIKMAPYLEDGQKVLLNSAGLGGALLFQATLRGTGYCPKITVAEADNCIYVCRSPEISKSLIKSIKKIICFSVLPLDQAQGFLDVIHNLYPQFQLVDDPLVNGIRHVNAAVHTAGVILNAERIKRKENFNFYTEGITPAIGSYIEMLEKERIAVAEKLGISTQTTRQWLHSVYNLPMDELYKMLQNHNAYSEDILAPKTFQHRFILEEVPAKMVPQLDIARILDIPQPLTTKIANKACELTGIDLFASGRTVEKLGLTEEDICRYAEQGIAPCLERISVQ